MLKQLSSRFQPFIYGAPVCVMVRSVLEYALASDFLDQTFQKFARKQYLRDLLFSSLVGLVCQVVCGVKRSICEAYQQSPQKIAVSITSVYNKLQGVEEQVSAELVRGSARRLAPLIEELGPLRPARLPGYRTRILDGNHLAGTEHRLKELRLTRSAPLPGQALVAYDPQLSLITDVFPCQDGHAQERSLIGQFLERVQSGELWIDDRNFCTTSMLFGITLCSAFFAIRQHASTLTWKPLGQRQAAGKADNGLLYEQAMQLEDPLTGQTMTIRRVTLVRYKPTAKGEREIHVLTNLPQQDASAAKVMELYRQRWTIEKAFGELERDLASEINTLGYPKAALLGFCVALAAYNALSVVKAALGAVHGSETVEQKVSGYYLAGEVASTYGGMMLAIPPQAWRIFGAMPIGDFTQTLKQLASSARLERYRKHPRGPKKPRPPRSSGKKIKHVSTARILAQRKGAGAP